MYHIHIKSNSQTKYNNPCKNKINNIISCFIDNKSLFISHDEDKKIIQFNYKDNVCERQIHDFFECINHL